MNPEILKEYIKSTFNRSVRGRNRHTAYVGKKGSTLSEQQLAEMNAIAFQIKELGDIILLGPLFQEFTSKNKVGGVEAWEILAEQIVTNYFKENHPPADINNVIFRQVMGGIRTIAAELEGSLLPMDNYAPFREDVGKISDLDTAITVVSVCPAAGIARRWHEIARQTISTPR